MAYDDLEQSERVKHWIRENGLSVVIGIVVGLAIIFGYRMWNQHKSDSKMEAASQYALVEQSLVANKPKVADSVIQSLKEHHADSSYTVLAVTLKAQHALDAGDAAGAVKALQWAAGHAKPELLKNLTDIRLARAQLNAGDAKAALATVKTLPDGAYPAMAAELAGDALAKQGDNSKAAESYRKALTLYPADAAQRSLVQMKLNSLPVANTVDTRTSGAVMTDDKAKQDA